MAKFVVVLKDKQKGTLTQLLLEQHVAHLRRLKSLGKLPLCGPFADNDGAFLLIEGDSINEVSQIVQSDPFVKQKYYQTVEMHELIESNEANNWLMDDSQTVGNLQEK